LLFLLNNYYLGGELISASLLVAFFRLPVFSLGEAIVLQTYFYLAKR